MLSVASSAGIDVGKLDVGFFPAAKPLRVVNEPTGIAKIVSVLRARGVGRVVLEAIGSYARKVICALVEAGFPVFVVNPRRIKMIIGVMVSAIGRTAQFKEREGLQDTWAQLFGYAVAGPHRPRDPKKAEACGSSFR